MLLIDGLPAGDVGRIEVFAGSSCTPNEARFVIDVNRTKPADQTRRPLSFQGNETRRHFSVTYTNAAGRTSVLSNCVEAAAAVDGDGDGAADQVESLLGVDGDPAAAAVVTDKDQLLLIGSVGLPDGDNPGGPPLAVPGRLRSVSVTDDPAPNGRPAGVELPYGVVQFDIDLRHRAPGPS